jgi:uncharacterized protein YdeI (YjbR/CyaY-like superfamily)
MSKKDPRIDSYIAKAADFAKPILQHLRELVHTGCPDVEETIKWGMPFFTYKGMLCNMAAFKGHCTFGFWKSALIPGLNNLPEDVENAAMGHFGRIATLSDLPPEKKLLGYIKAAAQLNEQGVKLPQKPKPKGPKTLAVPDFLTAALKKNKKAQKTFERFTYSHKKEYVEWLTEAKRPETRDQRLATALTWMADGKARNWKYANC